MSERQVEVAAYLERAKKSFEAAKELRKDGYQDFAASRAYYAAFYAASALIVNDGLDSSKHSGVIAIIHRDFVRTGKLDKEHGKNLNWLFELRSVGDYGIVMHVTEDDCAQAIRIAEHFIQVVETMLKK
jgi:uncharacterized protein (UPF0332 family)